MERDEEMVVSDQGVAVYPKGGMNCQLFHGFGEGWRSPRMWLCHTKGRIWPKKGYPLLKTFHGCKTELMTIWVKDKE